MKKASTTCLLRVHSIHLITKSETKWLQVLESYLESVFMSGLSEWFVQKLWKTLIWLIWSVFFINNFGEIVKSSCICLCISFDMWNCIWTRTRSWHWNRKSFYSTFSSSFMFQEAQNGFKNLFQRSVRLVKIE